MKRLVIGGPEKYDNTFVDWPDTYHAYQVLEEPVSLLFRDYDFEESFRGIHTYRLQRFITMDKEIYQVWMSEKRDFYQPLEHRYMMSLLMDCDFWKDRFRWIKSRDYILFQYKPFTEWEDIYEPVHVEKLRKLGHGFLNELVQRLLAGKEFYKVERIDQTAKIGSSSS